MVFCDSSSSSAFSSSSPCNLQVVGPGDSKSYVGGDGVSARVSALCKRRRCGGGGVKQPLLSQTFVLANSSPKLSQGLLLKTPNGAPWGHKSTLLVRSEHDNKRVVCFGEMLIILYQRLEACHWRKPQHLRKLLEVLLPMLLLALQGLGVMLLL
ncbi:unnamed protein product [Sphagnum balticum]